MQVAVSIGLCIAGDARTFQAALVRQSHLDYVISPLKMQGQLATFLVLGEGDRATLNMTRVHDDYEPAALVFTEPHDASSMQYERLATCGALFDAHEAAMGRAFDWTLRMRPDLYFYATLPRLDALSRDAVHARVRCFRFDANVTFTEEFISAENQMLLRSNCKAKPSACRACKQRHCRSSKSKAIDDQVALIPGAFRAAYFRSHAEMRALCPPPQIAECVLTKGVLEAGARISPTALHFTVARPEAKWHATTSEFRGLHFDAPLVSGFKSPSVADRTYRCAALNNSPHS